MKKLFSKKTICFAFAALAFAASAVAQNYKEVTAFKNPDASVAVVVFNKGDRNLRPLLRIKGSVCRLNTPKHSLTTLVLK